MKTARAILLCLLMSAQPAYAVPTFQDAFSPDRGATDLVIKTIGEAKKSIRVAAYAFTSYPIAEALVAAHARNVDVEVVMDESNRSHAYSVLSYLTRAGVPTRTNDHYAIMHNKFIIIDGSTLELGSFNFTKAAEEKNAENILVIKDVPQIAADYTKQWQRIWDEGAHPISKEARGER
jgi:phosphatidylserine/phosphatidylglycerophosphate/cardiolipin synthase-like enzyme